MIEERLYAKSLCHEYNQLHPRNIEERETLIKTLLGKTTDRVLPNKRTILHRFVQGIMQ
ncbi:hypothetical protein NLX78_23410 [Paenibacillus sp. Lou8.1]|uniref:maltose acetyltransferase domain-containing protein n=1 Tax=Paenibacillus sp. Lou8.1 TaxID=2962041 RepID=UPI001F3C7869|nr:maltose acetyltransferase domain-containing protein [Paenibacillus sp. Lou8.1]MCF2715810.1 hypothetical protein [Paenibacillus sp. UKAQ_18]MCP3810169.1 hypothetical protein [Paenibacillus sp. Lou8.1]